MSTRVNTGVSRIATKGLKKNMEAITGKLSTESLQKKLYLEKYT
jgi:hypothetical protein